jgi:hypothetical protein
MVKNPLTEAINVMECPIVKAVTKIKTDLQEFKV